MEEISALSQAHNRNMFAPFAARWDTTLATLVALAENAIASGDIEQMLARIRDINLLRNVMSQQAEVFTGMRSVYLGRLNTIGQKLMCAKVHAVAEP